MTMFSNNIKFENLDALNREVFSSAEEVDNIADYVSTGSILCREDGIRLLVLNPPEERVRPHELADPWYIITCYSLWCQKVTVLSCTLNPAARWLVGVITNGKKYRQR